MTREELVKKIQEDPNFKKFEDSLRDLAERIKEASGEAPKFNVSPGEGERAASNSGDLIKSIVSGSLTAGFALYKTRTAIDFSHVRDPSMQTAGRALGGYYETIINSMRIRESLVQDQRMNAISAVQNIAGLYLAKLPIFGSGAAGSQGRGLFASFIARALPSMGRTAARLFLRLIGTRLAGAAKRIGAVAAAGSIFGPAGTAVAGAVSTVIEAIVVSASVVKLITDHQKSETLKQFADNKALLEMFNPKNVMSLYENYKFLIPSEMERQDSNEGMSLLFGNKNESSITNRVYNLSRENERGGIELLGLGYDINSILATYGNLSKTVQTTSGLDSLTSDILRYSGLYTGTDTSKMTSILTTLTRAGGYGSKEVNEASERFAEFFAVVVGEGRPQAAHLNLVESLASFSYSYGSSERFNLNSAQEVAKIQQLMGDGGEINGRFDTTATTSAIKTIDSILTAGAMGTDLAAVRLFSYLDITSEEAILGVTNDANTFDKFLSGLINYLGVSNEDIDSGSSKFDEALANFARMMKMDTATLNPLIVAMRRYSGGARIEDVRQEYIDNLGDDLESKINEGLSSFGEQTSSVFDLVENIVVSANLIVDAVNENLEVVAAIQSAIQQLVLDGFGNFAEAFTNLVLTALGVKQATTFSVRDVSGNNPHGVYLHEGEFRTHLYAQNTDQLLANFGPKGNFRNDEVASALYEFLDKNETIREHLRNNNGIFGFDFSSLFREEWEKAGFSEDSVLKQNEDVIFGLLSPVSSPDSRTTDPATVPPVDPSVSPPVDPAGASDANQTNTPDAPTAVASPPDAPTAVASPPDAPTAVASPPDAPTAVASPPDAPTAVASPPDAPTAVASPPDAPTAVASPPDAPTAVASPPDAPTAVHPLQMHPLPLHPLQMHPLPLHPLQMHPLPLHPLQMHPLPLHPLQMHPHCTHRCIPSRCTHCR
jgi:hypothetical protein